MKKKPAQSKVNPWKSDAPLQLDDDVISRVLTSLEKGNLNIFEGLTAAQRDFVISLFKQISEGDTSTLEALYSVDYERIPVDPDVFFTERDYMGHIGRDIYKAWWGHLMKILDPASGIFEVILTGPIGNGKCSRWDTLIPTAKGFLTAQEIYEDKVKAGIETESGTRKVKKRFNEGSIQTIRMVTERGHEFEGSPHHRLRVLDGFTRKWKKLSELRQGDVVLVHPSHEERGGDVPLEAAELTGWFIAEGNSTANGAQLNVHESEMAYVEGLARKAKGWLPYSRVKVGKNGTTLHLTGGKAASENLAIVWGTATSHYKTIPRFIRVGNEEVICAFLRGLFSGDGDSGRFSSPTLTTMSRRLAHQVGTLLTYLGIYSSIREKRATYKGEDYGTAYNVTIVGADSQARFAEKIGFYQDYKHANLLRRLHTNQNSDHFYALPLAKEWARKLKDMQPTERGGNNKYSKYGDKKKSPKGLLDRIVRGQRLTLRLMRQVLKAGGKLPKELFKLAVGATMFDVVAYTQKDRNKCYDFSMEGDPSYITNGFVSHNTLISQAMLSYKIYRLSCLKDPARYFGLAKKSRIVFGVYSLTLENAEDVGFYKLRDQCIDESPYFREVFPRRPFGTDYIEWPQKQLKVITGCVAEGTKIATPNGQVPIEQLHQHAYLTTRDKSGLFASPFGGVVFSGIKTTFDLLLENGHSVRSTEDHKYLVLKQEDLQTVRTDRRAQMLPLSKIKVGDYVCCMQDVSEEKAADGFLPPFTMPLQRVCEESKQPALPRDKSFETQEEVETGTRLLHPLSDGETTRTIRNTKRRQAPVMVQKMRFSGIGSLAQGKPRTCEAVGCRTLERPPEAGKDAAANETILSETSSTYLGQMEEFSLRRTATCQCAQGKSSCCKEKKCSEISGRKSRYSSGEKQRVPSEESTDCQGGESKKACVGTNSRGDDFSGTNSSVAADVLLPLRVLQPSVGNRLASGSFDPSFKRRHKLSEQSHTILREVQSAKGEKVFEEFCIRNIALSETEVSQNTSLCWHRVKAIFPAGKQRTYDVYEVPETHLVFTNGIASSNSGALHAIGKDLFAIMIDEINFMAKGKATAGKAHELATAVSRRLESRFMTGMTTQDIPGICVFVSSKKAETDYLEQRIKKVRGLPGVHVVDGPFWEFNEKIDYSGETFRMLLGDAVHDPMLLDEVTYSDSGAVVAPALAKHEEARLEGRVIDVPVEHYKAFVEDINGAIRDVAGIATSATVNFFPRKRVLSDMFDEGKTLPKFFPTETLRMPIRSPVRLTEIFDIETACGVQFSQRIPLRHSKAPRYIHIDLARNTDALGMVMVHPSEFSFSEDREIQGVVEEGIDKQIEVDFALRVTTDDTGEDIDFEKIVRFVKWLKENGFWIRKVTYDSWQSAHSIQQLKILGIPAGVRSVDKTMIPYNVLQRALGERRVACPYHSILNKELGELEYDAERDKVDHPKHRADGTPGSKDVADALAATVYECILDKLTPDDEPTQAMVDYDERYEEYLDDLKEFTK